MGEWMDGCMMNGWITEWEMGGWVAGWIEWVDG